MKRKDRGATLRRLVTPYHLKTAKIARQENASFDFAGEKGKEEKRTGNRARAFPQEGPNRAVIGNKYNLCPYSHRLNIYPIRLHSRIFKKCDFGQAGKLHPNPHPRGIKGYPTCHIYTWSHNYNFIGGIGFSICS